MTCVTVINFRHFKYANKRAEVNVDNVDHVVTSDPAKTATALKFDQEYRGQRSYVFHC